MRGAWLALLLSAACIGTSPEEAAREALGKDDDGDAEHRPGQPCLTCHGEDYHPGGDVFVIAGTVFLYPSDEVGVSGALVEITDDEGHQYGAPTNRTGNFMVSVKPSLDRPRLTRRGNLQIPSEPVYPLRIRVWRGDDVREMESWIWREGSCAGCHVGDEDTGDSVARVYLREEGL